MKRLLKKIGIKRLKKKYTIKGRRVRFWRNTTVQRVLIAAGAFILLSMLVTQGQVLRKPNIDEGEIADRDIIAPFKFPVHKDDSALREERDKAAERVLPMFAENENMPGIVRDDIRSFYNIVGQLSTVYADTEKSDQERFVRELNMGISEESLVYLFGSDDLPYLESKTEEVVVEVYRDGVLDYEVISEKQLGFTLHVRWLDEERETVESVNSLNDLRAAAFRASEVAGSISGLKPEEVRVIGEVAAAKIQPNILYDEAETEKRREAARETVDPILRWVEANEKIVESHTRVTSEQITMVEALYSGASKSNLVYTFGGRALLVLAVLTIIGIYLRRNRPEYFEKPSLWLMIGIILVSVTFVNRVISLFLISSAPWTLFLFGVALGAMLITLLLDTTTGYMVAVVLSVLAGIAAGIEMRPTLIALVGGIWSVFLISRIRQRSDFYWVALGLVSAAIVVSIGVALADMNPAEKTLRDVLWGSALTVTSVFVVAVALPLFENVFKITTGVKLLELADLNQPLLKRLLIEAPGTYHHSILVGTLAESAAQAIGENPLTARAAAYYHDIGKLRSPGYFAENAGLEAHRHDKLSPQMSSLIIASHTKLGAEMAEGNRLPQVIIDAISEHHGTALISFFYQEALKMDEHKVLETDDFRYPGPKPKSKISAIIMLADAVESASRSLEEPTLNNIRNLVDHIVQGRLEDGQFDKTDLTMKEIYDLKENLITGVKNIFHIRPSYPSFPDDLEAPVLSVADMEAKRN
ncbi:MAG: HDIG domain-containing protein [bacterium]|nr:HDIG domain-containing protein [bacterium]